MKTEPLLGAAAFGAVAAVLYNLINTLIAVQSPAFEGLGMGLNCFVGLLIALVTGFLYAYLHRREASLTAGVGAKGGLAAGVLAFALNGVVSIVIVMLLGPQIMVTTLAAGGFTEPLDTGAINTVLMGGALVLQCIGIAMNALVSAAGGAVGVALLVASSTATGLRPCRMAHEAGGVHALYEDDVSGAADVFYLNLLPKIDIKRYFAGSRQLAVRAQEALYYLLHDPTGTSLVIADEAGNGLGQILYDGYGAVLSATLPVTVSNTLLDAPDPTTRLVHLDEGRWYDPALGRPLQPNAIGGPPTVPQALNRYAATTLGQPGVAQAEEGNVFKWTPAAVSFSYGTLSEVSKLTVRVSQLTGYRYTGKAVVEATASFSALTRSRSFPKHLNELFGSPTLAYVENGRSFYTRRAVIELAGGSSDELTGAVDDIVSELVQSLPRRKPWTAAVAGRLVGQTAWPQYSTKALGQLDNWSNALTGIGAGIDFVVGAGLQLHADAGSPYLSSYKVGVRVGLAGFGSAASGYFGGLVGGAALGWVCGPGVVICSSIGAVLGAVGGGVAWNAWGQRFVFELIGVQPDARNLLRLD